MTTTEIFGKSGTRYIMQDEDGEIVLYDATWYPILTPLDRIPDKED